MHSYIEIGVITGGVLMSLAVGYLFGRRRNAAVIIEPDPLTNQEIDAEIFAASAEWAARHGRPELAGLLARKAQLGMQLEDQLEDQARSRWS